MIGLLLISNKIQYKIQKGTLQKVPFLYNKIMYKQDLRKAQKEIRKNLNLDFLSEKIVNNLFKLNDYKNAKNVFTYISLENEINTNRILNDKTKNIFIPKIKEQSLIMTKYDKNNLSKNRFGILELLTNENILPQKKDIIIIPALACDKFFDRLGYGGGYYDRYLKNTNGIKVVLIPEALLIDEIPTEKHDVKVDIIVTENNFYINTNSI